MHKFIQMLILSMTALTGMAQDKPKPPVFTPLSSESKAELANFRQIVADLISKRGSGQHLSQTTNDFVILQALAEDSAMKKSDRNTWIAVGVSFGDALIALVPGLAWWDVQDEYGPGVVLRYKQTTLTIAAPVMLTKRIERGESFDLPFMADELKKFVQENAGKVQ